MDLLARLEHTWQERPYPFLEHGDSELHFRDVAACTPDFLSDIRPGDVVALIGDFDPVSISCLLQLIQRRAIVVPLENRTRPG